MTCPHTNTQCPTLTDVVEANETMVASIIRLRNALTRISEYGVEPVARIARDALKGKS